MQIVVLLLTYLLVLGVQPLNGGPVCPGGGDAACFCNGNVDGEDICYCFAPGFTGDRCNECDKGSFSLVSLEDEKCAGYGGSVAFSVVNTYTPALLELDGSSQENSFPMGTQFSFTNLPPDTYDAEAYGTVSTDNLCIVRYRPANQTYDFTINAARPIIASASPNVGACLSSLSITATGGNGGTAAFLYSIDGTSYQALPTFDNLAPGLYTYYVKDTSVTDVDCVKKFNVTISSSSIVPTVNCVATPPKCFGDLSQITISASGGSSFYTYSIDNTNYNSTTTYWEPAGLDYTCYVKDTSGCTISKDVSVPAGPTEILVSANPKNVTCFGAHDGSCTFSGSGGTGGLAYSLDGIIWGTGFSNLEPGSHLFYVRDENNCTTSNSFVIGTPQEIAPLIKSTNDTCSGTPSGSISFTFSGPTNHLLISFNGSAYENKTWQFNGLAPGTYSYSIMDLNHCVVSSSVTIYQISRGNCSNGICGANSVCIDSTCGYVCNCTSGYFRNGTICQDVDECAADNGGCDYRTICANTPGTRTCSRCPNGTIPSGNECKVTCGNGACEPQFENCVNCFADCNTTTCNMCDDGYCDPTIGETCTTCSTDCGPCGQQTCVGGCGAHGMCSAGVCKCDSTWSGPTCSSPSQPINITYNQTDPSATLDPSHDYTNFFVSLKSISEINPSGAVLRSFALSAINFTLHANSSGLNIVNNYSAVLPNRALMSVILQQFEENATSVTFAGMNDTFPAHTLKLNVIIRQWPFLALANSLSLTIGAVASQNDTPHNSCVDEKEDPTGNLRWVLIVVGNTSLYGQFQDRAEVDGRIRVINYRLNPDKTIAAILPNFWDYVDMDPSFSVLVGDETSSKCGKSANSKSGVNKKLIEIIVPAVVGAAIITALVLALFPKVKTWWQLNHTKSAYELEADDFKTEYKPDMRAQTEAGDFRVRY